MYTIYAAPGSASAIVEAMLTSARLPYSMIAAAPWEEQTRPVILAVNPLAQVPALRLPDGSIMTESAAIVLHITEAAPEAGLAPAPGDPERARFLRWLMFLAAAIYPLLTFGDHPSRWIEEEASQKIFRTRTDARSEDLWRLVEAEASGPWFLGHKRSAIDLYIWVMMRWRPSRDWFRAECPKLWTAAAALDRHPPLEKILKSNFG